VCVCVCVSKQAATGNATTGLERRKVSVTCAHVSHVQAFTSCVHLYYYNSCAHLKAVLT